MKKISSLLVVSILLTNLFFVNVFANEENNSEVLDLSIEKAIEDGIKNSDLIEIQKYAIEVEEVKRRQAISQERKYDDAVDMANDFGIRLELEGSDEGIYLSNNMLSEQAEVSLEREKLKNEYNIEDLKMNITKAYYMSLIASKNLDIAKNNLENTKRNEEIVNKKYELGVASKSDLLFAQIEVDEAKANLETAKTNKEKAFRSLNMVLDYDLDTQLNLTSEFQKVENERDLENDLKKSYETRLDYVDSKNTAELARKDLETLDDRYGENTYKYRIAQGNTLRAEKAFDAKEKGVEFDVKNKFDAIDSEYRKIELAKSTVEKAKEALRLKELSYEAGMGTLLQVKEARNSLYKAELNLSNSILNYNIAILDYKKAVTIGNIN
ncbi:TolC family protein [Peptostreptococcaceae bacterium AGR-M142]